MAIVVRIRGVEVVCESLDDLDSILERYGSSPDGAIVSPASRNGSGRGTGADTALLRALVEAGSTGISSQMIGDMLGTRGKGVPPALQKWGVRVGLAQGDGKPFDPARPQGGRGWKLKEGAMSVARHLLGQAG